MVNVYVFLAQTDKRTSYMSKIYPYMGIKRKKKFLQSQAPIYLLSLKEYQCFYELSNIEVEKS